MTQWTLGMALCVAAAAAQAAPAGDRPGRARKNQSSASQPASPDPLAGATSETYKTVGDVRLKVHIFNPPGHTPAEPRAAIVFFFGGGWLRGSAGQFAPQCRYFAARGMVAITADYRVHERHQATVADCVADTQAAIRWVRANAKRLGIRPDRIAASGGSAGGHLAAATALLKDFTGDPDARVSCRPDALILFNPAVDLTRDEPKPGQSSEWRSNLLKRLGAPADDLSPVDHVRPNLPPTIIFHGRADHAIPFETVEQFTRAMREAGNRCELVGFDGQGHGFFNAPKKGTNRYFDETLQLADRFLAALGYLRAQPATAPGPAATRPQ